MNRSERPSRTGRRVHLLLALGCVSLGPTLHPALAQTPPPTAPATAKSGSTEPEFKAGIPGLKMADVRDHKQLWRDLDEIQVRESGDRISAAEFRRQSIELTSRFLQFEGGAADRFALAAADEVAWLRRAFLKSRQNDASTASGGDPFSGDLSASASRLSAFLGDAPRHRLFIPDEKKWLLRLAFSPREKKEAREQSDVEPSAGQARNSGG